MVKYTVVEEKRTAGENSVFKGGYRHRMTVKGMSNNKDKLDHQFGAASRQVQVDLPRSTFILSKGDLVRYEKNLAKLNGKNFAQGDLDAGSDLAALRSGILSNNAYNAGNGELSDEQIPVRLCRFSYLRKDGTIGGVSLLIDNATQSLCFAVVNYPENSTSYNDGNVKYFFPDSLPDVLTTTAKKKDISESEMLSELKIALNHDDISQLVETIVTDKSPFISAGANFDSLFQVKTQPSIIEITKPQSTAIIRASSGVLGIIGVGVGVALVATGILAPLGMAIGFTSMLLFGMAVLNPGSAVGRFVGRFTDAMFNRSKQVKEVTFPTVDVQLAKGIVERCKQDAKIALTVGSHQPEAGAVEMSSTATMHMMHVGDVSHSNHESSDSDVDHNPIVPVSIEDAGVVVAADAEADAVLERPKQ